MERIERRLLVKDEDVADDPNFERKFDLVTEGAHPYLKKHLLERITKENCMTIVNYMLAMQTEVSPLLCAAHIHHVWGVTYWLSILPSYTFSLRSYFSFYG